MLFIHNSQGSGAEKAEVELWIQKLREEDFGIPQIGAVEVSVCDAHTEIPEREFSGYDIVVFSGNVGIQDFNRFGIQNYSTLHEQNLHMQGFCVLFHSSLPVLVLSWERVILPNPKSVFKLKEAILSLLPR